MMTDYTYMEDEELKDIVSGMKQELWNISYDWHNVAPILRNNIVMAEQELARRAG